MQHISEELKVSCLVQMCLACPLIQGAWWRVRRLQNINNNSTVTQTKLRTEIGYCRVGKTITSYYYVEGVQGKKEFGSVLSASSYVGSASSISVRACEEIAR